jgi:hypothetical protein
MTVELMFKEEFDALNNARKEFHRIYWSGFSFEYFPRLTLSELQAKIQERQKNSFRNMFRDTACPLHG